MQFNTCWDHNCDYLRKCTEFNLIHKYWTYAHLSIYRPTRIWSQTTNDINDLFQCSFKHWWNLVLRTSLIWHCVTECSRFWRRDNNLFGLWKYFSKWHASRVRILICTISTHAKRHFKLFSKAVHTGFVYAMEMAWNEILLLINKGH